ncbi:Dual specificity tyrosine-phosphorylation-regulated kinase 2 [Orchesella cincta]|uniref:Dual specificity tyrosine-phosphorylation-regulated kinase 2 n=1 Tax=Orchesella cincta TaxID=48709 RepID=A0A1D2M3L6_ORCCI|nr:Dual specificity tyrosine-phosphorylation-regulated kinase 2 [Orchesella cincta]
MQWSLITEEVREGPNDRGILKKGGISDHHPATKQSKSSGKYMSPQQALTQHGSKLTLFERAEIVTFLKSITGLGSQQNWEDSEHHLRKVLHPPNARPISYRYELLESLGKGDTSQVFKALDHKTGAHVALKIIRNEDHLQIDAEQEVSILTQLKNNVNVVEILDSFQFRNHSCIVFELLARNLSRLKFETCYKGFTPQQVKKFVIPVLQCLQDLSRNGIVHGDLNLENILLKQEYRDEIKVIDFGSSLAVLRAPELILGIEYGTPVDMWAVGCVVVELFTGQKLVPGEDEQDQMACILECLENLRKKATRAKEFFSDKNNMIPAYCEEKTKKMEEDFGSEEEGKWEDKRTSRNQGFGTCAGNARRCQAGVFGFREKVLALGAGSEVETFSGSSPSLDQEDELKISDEEWNVGGGGGVAFAGNVARLEPKEVGWEN